ncbi:YjjG family noncanonical pyrimidine nucleotidase [Chitinophagaceae bacterium LB-8]|uniref:YjjG family noncanonical pyrimidine nucleotidase n=1 Tax=Paraflavisolibacter caeni TaxID=2982496 RepID=A0A9X2XS46_9BACT|nr:YjjG family noncanonical pyrimidine nucleotidase [Paraflavisolibacter caeni]MCU7547811.1 YjjG family noncanonical pyrimidine nucleotidase [Paraflavisolibacter caeni]
MKYKHIFFDLDHTLWDFDANARQTLEQMHFDLKLAERGVHDFELFYNNYLKHNEKLWERYRKGYIKQDELRLKRMWLALLDFKIADETLAREMSDLFLQLLPSRTIIFPHTKEILQYLTNKGYQLHLITNGFEKVQLCKLQSCGLDHFFKAVITSESSNSLKPEKEIFEFAMSQTGATVKESIMIGDTIEVDIAGAINVGMDQVHVNYSGAEQNLKPTYTVRTLKELEDIF